MAELSLWLVGKIYIRFWFGIETSNDNHEGVIGVKAEE